MSEIIDLDCWLSEPDDNEPITVKRFERRLLTLHLDAREHSELPREVKCEVRGDLSRLKSLSVRLLGNREPLPESLLLLPHGNGRFGVLIVLPTVAPAHV
jgi:hypothetical protein